MTDKYANFAALEREEPPTAYAIRLRSVGSKVVVVAPHGGAIEPGTSEVAIALAGEEFSYYVFEGQKAKANADLHITSSNFDEPLCLQLITKAEVVITVHGEASKESVAFLGGRHSKLVAAIHRALSSSGFAIAAHDSPALQGRDRSNIVNRGSRGEGVQLELSRGLRERLFTSLQPDGRTQPTELLGQFALAVRSAMRESQL